MELAEVERDDIDRKFESSLKQRCLAFTSTNKRSRPTKPIDI